jgi:hypothetical protein
MNFPRERKRRRRGKGKERKGEERVGEREGLKAPRTSDSKDYETIARALGENRQVFEPYPLSDFWVVSQSPERVWLTDLQVPSCSLCTTSSDTGQESSKAL